MSESVSLVAPATPRKRTFRRPTANYLDHGLKVWIAKTARKNYWRVARHYDLADLIQDGYMCYAICRARYATKVDGPGHFVSLVKTTYNNHITDLAAERYKEASFKEIPISQFNRPEHMTDEQLLESLGGNEINESEMMATLNSASVEIREMLNALHSQPSLGRMISNTRATTNEKLNRVIGTVGHDFARQLRQLFGMPTAEPSKPKTGFTYGGDLDEFKRTAAVNPSAPLCPRDRRKVYTVTPFTYRFLPATP